MRSGSTLCSTYITKCRKSLFFSHWFCVNNWQRNVFCSAKSTLGIHLPCYEIIASNSFWKLKNGVRNTRYQLFVHKTIIFACICSSYGVEKREQKRKKYFEKKEIVGYAYYERRMCWKFEAIGTSASATDIVHIFPCEITNTRRYRNRLLEQRKWFVFSGSCWRENANERERERKKEPTDERANKKWREKDFF